MSDPAESQARRRFLKIAVIGAAAAPITAALLPLIARAENPHLSEIDATAKALSYTEDATTAKGNAAYKPGSVCAACQFFQGHEEMPYAACTLFPGKAVNSKGWCASWTLRG